MPYSLLLLFAIVLSHPSTGFAQSTKQLELVRELSIGAADGPPEYAFGSLGSMAISPTGAFFLFDQSDTQLRRYDASGRFQGLVGRAGSGPGEYRQVLGLAMHGDSLLLVFDPANGRIALFDTTGAYRRSIPFARGTFFGEKAFTVDRKGLIYVRASLNSGPTEGSGLRSQFVRLRLDGTFVDSLPLPVEGMEGSFVLLTADGARWSFPTRTIFNTLPTGGLVTANSAAYRITLAPIGASPLVIERSFTPVKLTGPERDEWEAFARYFASRPGASRTSTIPRVKPAIRDLFADPTGRIWVNVYTNAVKRAIPPRNPGDLRPLLTIREVNIYDIFNPQGAYLGRVELPPQSRLLGIHEARLWVRTEAEGGEYILTRYRVPGLVGR